MLGQTVELVQFVTNDSCGPFAQVHSLNRSTSVVVAGESAVYLAPTQRLLPLATLRNDRQSEPC